MVIIDQFGGAVARVPNDATAFGHRDAAYDLIIAAIWSDQAEQDDHVEWAKSFWEAMQPYSTGEVYVNYLSDEGDERVRSAYGHHWERLVELKRRTTPTTSSARIRTFRRRAGGACGLRRTMFEPGCDHNDSAGRHVKCSR